MMMSEGRKGVDNRYELFDGKSRIPCRVMVNIAGDLSVMASYVDMQVLSRLSASLESRRSCHVLAVGQERKIVHLSCSYWAKSA